METNNNKNARYYIAYGSNLSVKAMAWRCPDARVVGTATLEGWQLVMSCYATIVPNPSMKTPVLIWTISERDERNLDCYEGFPTLYYKKNLSVEVFPLEGAELEGGTTDGRKPMQLEAMVYIMNEKYPKELPSQLYYKILREGYEAFHFPLEVLEAAMEDAKENAGKPIINDAGAE